MSFLEATIAGNRGVNCGRDRIWILCIQFETFLSEEKWVCTCTVGLIFSVLSFVLDQDSELVQVQCKIATT